MFIKKHTNYLLTYEPIISTRNRERGSVGGRGAGFDERQGDTQRRRVGDLRRLHLAYAGEEGVETLVAVMSGDLQGGRRQQDAFRSAKDIELINCRDIFQVLIAFFFIFTTVDIRPTIHLSRSIRVTNNLTINNLFLIDSSQFIVVFIILQ